MTRNPRGNQVPRTTLPYATRAVKIPTCMVSFERCLQRWERDGEMMDNTAKLANNDKKDLTNDGRITRNKKKKKETV